jgi:hypothetical protein
MSKRHELPETDVDDWARLNRIEHQKKALLHFVQSWPLCFDRGHRDEILEALFEARRAFKLEVNKRIAAENDFLGRGRP